MSKKGIYFKKQKTYDNNYKNPLGPGQYNTEKKKKFKFTFSLSKKKTNNKEILPGPSDYKIKHNSLLKGIKFFKAKKDDMDLKNNYKVGPGDYDLKSTIPDVAKYNYPDKRYLKIKL